ncbi:MAG: lysine decarboxylase LdcC [Pseudomonadota bacterium]
MHSILFIYSDAITNEKLTYFNHLEQQLEQLGFAILPSENLHAAIVAAKANSRITGIILDWEQYDLDSFAEVANFNPHLPVFAVGNTRQDVELNLSNFQLNLDFLQFDTASIRSNVDRIAHVIHHYQQKILPPFTRQLIDYAEKNNYSFCTPGHQGGHGFQRTPAGTLFYDFYGDNLFKSDISISMAEMGSLLEHSGPYKEAENFIANTFNADRSLIVTNGTSTSNKIVGMYAVADGDTILVDRNCHKSIAHLMMMVDVNPIYLKPNRNAQGIIGGIPKSEFSRESIQHKLDRHPVAKSWPSYAVITNSTYDGIFYNVHTIKNNITVNTLHFDSAWVPYTNFHPIYKGKYGMYSSPNSGQTIFETQSTHKLLAAFSQASMIHIKGEYDEERLNEAFMMHTSTSPFYPLVASTEISAAMLRGKVGYHLINDVIDCAIDFRKELIRLKKTSPNWFYDVWQPDDIDIKATWPLQAEDNWHGFNELDDDHLYLDPVKVTVLLPGIKDEQMEDHGIPATIVSAFLEDHGIIVEKTGPYSMLFLFSIGITQAKSMRLIAVLNKFKQMYDQNLPISDVLPSIYKAHPEFYAEKKIQDVAASLHQLMTQHKLPQVMYHAFDTLPEFVINPHRAYQKLVKKQTSKLCIDDLLGKTSAVMVLPYPPGIPIIMPGEKITADCNVILDFLLMLETIGNHLPGFETEIHGLTKGADGRLYIQVICE